MRYLLGTDGEQATFADEGNSYGPAGMRHAVDTAAPTYRQNCAVAYAVCGKPVRCWEDQAFDPDDTGGPVHDACARAVR